MSEQYNPVKRTSYKEQVGRSIAWGHYFIFINILLACLLGYSYVYAAPPTHSFLAFFYLIVTWLGHMSFLTVVSYLVLFFPLAFIGNFRVYRVLSVCLAVILHAILLFDIKIFLIAKVHLSLAAINLIVRELDFNTGLNYNFLFIAVPIVIVLELIFAKVTTHSLYKEHHNIFVRFVLALVCTCFIVSHCLHIWADAYKYDRITLLRSTFPAHYPMTARSFLSNHGWLNESQVSQEQATGADYVEYPLSKITSTPSESPYNVVVVNFNGLSLEDVNQDNTPNLISLKRDGQSFEQNYLLYGNELDNVFAMNYGIPLQYRSALIEQQSLPITQEEMFRQDYVRRLIVSSPAIKTGDKGKDNEARARLNHYFDTLSLYSGLRRAQLKRETSDLSSLSRALGYLMHKSRDHRPLALTVVLNDVRDFENATNARLKHVKDVNVDSEDKDNVDHAIDAAQKRVAASDESKGSQRAADLASDMAIDVAAQYAEDNQDPLDLDGQGDLHDAILALEKKVDKRLKNDLSAQKDPEVRDKIMREDTLRISDAALGAFVNELKERGILDHTVLIITSTEGNESYHDMRKVRRVPLIVLWPNNYGVGTTVSVISSIQDIPATIAQEVLNITSTAGTYTLGSNLKGLIRRPYVISDAPHEMLLIGVRDTTIYEQDGSSYILRDGNKLKVRPNLEDLIQSTRDLNRFLR